MKKILLALAVLMSVTFGISGLAVAASPSEAAKNQVCEGISGQVGGTCGDGGADIQNIIAVVLNILSWIAGIAAVIMIILAGLKYITSSGDSSSISSAKSSLIYALVGLVIVALSQAIVFFILGATA